jgi:HIRAN domain
MMTPLIRSRQFARAEHRMKGGAAGRLHLNRLYRARELFPLFKNRVLSPKRPEYPDFIQWLGLNKEDASPVAILERSGGLRGTDKLQVFKRFEIDSDGSFEYTFFAHGLGYLPASANSRVTTLVRGDRLFLCPDPQNEHDKNAIIIRAEDPAEIVGYCPRYLAKTILMLLELGVDCPRLTVETLSDSAPANYRLLCKVEGQIDSNKVGEFMLDDEFQLISG